MGVQVSDAYVVALQSPATMKVDGKEFNSTTVEANGTVVFEIPKDMNLSNAHINIPEDAIVDSDGDGVLSEKDQLIRMGLKAKGVDCVANPIATVVLEHNDTKAYEDAKDFDPVEAKRKLIEESLSDAHKKAMVALSDAIALLEKMAKENGKDAAAVVGKIDAKKIKEFIHTGADGEEDINNMLNNIFADALSEAEIDTDLFYDKVEEILNTIDDAKVAVHEKRRALHEALAAVIAVSDADANAVAIREAMRHKGDISDITKHIHQNIKVRDFIQHKHLKSGSDNNGTDKEMHGSGEEKMKKGDKIQKEKKEKDVASHSSDKEDNSDKNCTKKDANENMKKEQKEKKMDKDKKRDCNSSL